MKQLIIYCFILILCSSREIAAQSFPASEIPDSLKESAHAVIREYTRDLELKSVNSGIERIRRVITVLDRNGENSAIIAIPYDKYTSVDIKKIVIYDVAGKKVKSVKQSEVEDSPSFSSYELYSDERIKYYKPIYVAYPYTVEYEYETNNTNLISYGCWRPFNGYNISLLHARFTVNHSSSVKINIKESGLKLSSYGSQNNTQVELCEMNNLKAIEDEPFDISVNERIPSAYLMPTVLMYEKFEGPALNWEQYGSWIFRLYQNRDELSPEDNDRITMITKSIPDTLERIKLLYKYMQENTRYVAVTLGIGGYQPFDAKTVFKTGYGDCKALSNYMYSLLKSVGIKSFPALVAAGNYKVPVFTDFPNFLQFNHVILCIPVQKDTVWLECTDQKIPFGFLGDFTDDRKVLLLTAKGGLFAHTRGYKAEDNLRECKSEFKVDSTGMALCSITTLYHGLEYDKISSLLRLNYDEQKKWLYDNSTLPSLLINNFSIDEIRNEIPVADVKETCLSKNYCSFTGKYMLLPLNLLNGQNPIPKMLKPRHSDVLISRSSKESDTLIYKIPKNYKYESLPSGSTINSEFGSYSFSVSGTENEIVYIRKFEIKEGRYKPAAYKELYDFLLSVSKADNAKVILTKKT